jgi:pilus biogenesis lipoprotein CpaD
MNKTNRGILALASLLLLGACDLRLNEHVMKARESVDLRQANRVDLVQYHHQVNFEGGRNNPTEAEYDRFDAFAQSIQLGYADELVLRGGAPARQSAVADYVERRGLLATVKLDPGSKEEMASNTVKVVVNRHVVTPPACPNWSNFDGNENRNTPGSNYGCAVDSSLGYMVANPRDLIQGQTMDPAYSNPMIRTLRNYEAGKAIQPKRQSTGGQ